MWALLRTWFSSRAGAVLAFVFGCVVMDARVALAQTTGDDAGDAAPESTESGEAAAEREATERFEHGMHAYTNRRYEEALDAFRGADARVPSPNTRLMIARCLRELGRVHESIDSFLASETLAKARIDQGESRYEPTRSAARTERAMVERGAGRIEVDGAGKEVRVLLAGALVHLSAGEPRIVRWVTPGDHTVERHRPGGIVERHTVHVEAGETATVRFAPVGDQKSDEAHSALRPAPPEAPGRRQRRWAWPLAVGAGALTLGATGSFVAFGLDSENRYQRVRDACQAGECGDAQRADAEVGARHQTIANISLVVAGASLVATGVLIWLALDDGREPNAKASRLRFSPAGLDWRF